MITDFTKLTIESMESMTLKELTTIYNDSLEDPSKHVMMLKCSRADAIKKIIKNKPLTQIEIVPCPETEPIMEEKVKPVKEPKAPKVKVDKAVPTEGEVKQDIKKFELRNPKEISDQIPELVVLDKVKVVSGTGESKVQYQLDDKFKIAGHICPETGSFKAARSLKTLKYNELSHKNTFNTLTASLVSLGLDFGVWKARYTSDYDIATYDFVLNKQYKINETPFELMGNRGQVITYNGNDSKRLGIYQPMVRLTNSFLGSCRLDFAMVRIMCWNGMMHIADKLSIGFSHITSGIVSVFEEKCTLFLNSIFSKNYVERLMGSFTNIPLDMISFYDWLSESAGPRITEHAEAKFKIGPSHELAWPDNSFNAWVGFNILTYITTHNTPSLRKHDVLYKGFIDMIGYEEPAV